MDDTLTIYVSEAPDDERRRRRRRRIVAALAVGVIAAALADQPPGTKPEDVAKPPLVVTVETKPAETESIPASPYGPPSPATEAVASPPAKVIASPAELEFENDRRPRLAVLRNDGGTAVERVSVSVGKPFLVSHNCARGIAPGATCVVAVAFDPQGTGRFTGALNIVAGDDRTRIPLRGRVAEPRPIVGEQVVEDAAPPAQTPPRPRVLCFEPAVVTFLTAGTKWVTLTNTQSEPLTIAAIRVNGSGYRIDGCLGILPPGAKCRFSITPGRAAMIRHQTVQIAVDAVDPVTGGTLPVHRDTNCRR